MPMMASNNANPANTPSANIAKRRRASDSDNHWSIVLTSKIVIFGSNDRTSAVILAARLDGTTLVRATRYIVLPSAWAAGKYNVTRDSLSRSYCLTLPTTPTTVTQGSSESARPNLIRLPRGLLLGQ